MLFKITQRLLILTLLSFNPIFASSYVEPNSSFTDLQNTAIQVVYSSSPCLSHPQFQIEKEQARQDLGRAIPEYYNGGGKLYAPVAVLKQYHDLIVKAHIATYPNDGLSSQYNSGEKDIISGIPLLVSREDLDQFASENIVK